MKNLKRIISFTFALVIVITGLNVSGVIATAAAEEIATAGSTKVPATPETLSYVGEWAFWVEEDVAYIAGYGNEYESVLKIPGSLGGFPVVGIGENAFRRNEGLELIQMHTNVTRISENAFDRGKDITIKAYNGSYALQFAKEQGFRSVNLSTAAVFAKNVVDLTGLSAQKAYSGLSDTGVTFKKTEASFIDVGQILYFPKQAGYPTGLAKKISSISVGENTIDIVFSQPQWGEVFIQVSGEDELYVDWDNARWGAGFELDGEVNDSGTETKWFSDVSKSVSVNIDLGSGWEVEGSLAIGLKGAKATWTLEREWYELVPRLEFVEVKLPFETSKSLSLKYKNDDKTTTLVPRQQIIGKKCDLATVPVASVGGVINGYITVKMVFEISGEAKLSTNILTTFTFTYQNNKLSCTKAQKETHSWYFGGKAKVGPELKLYFVLGVAGFAIRFFETGAGIYIVAEGGITGTSVTGAVDQVLCTEVSLKLNAEISAKAGVISITGFDFSAYKEISQEWDLVNFGTWHFERGLLPVQQSHSAATIFGRVLFEKETGSCSLDGRTVYYDTGTGKTINETHDVNEKLTAPVTPSRSGYTTVSMEPGETKTLTYKVFPAEAEQQVEYESLNSSVATIDKTTGVIMAVAPGTASILAVASTGRNVKAIVTINVNEPVVDPTPSAQP